MPISCPPRTPCPSSPASQAHPTLLTPWPQCSMTTGNPWLPRSLNRFSLKGVFRASWHLWKLVTGLFVCGWQGGCFAGPLPSPGEPIDLRLLLTTGSQLAARLGTLPSHLPLALWEGGMPLAEGWTSLRSLLHERLALALGAPSELQAFSELWRIWGPQVFWGLWTLF